MRPKTIYYYDNKTLLRHKVTNDCMVELLRAKDSPDVRYRCRITSSPFRGPDAHDIYGHGTLKEAKADEIEQTKIAIYREKEWLKELGSIPDDDQD